MIKRFLLWLLREELADIRAEAEEDTRELREFILGSLSISFKSIRDRIDSVEALALETTKAVERLDDGHNLLSGAHNHLDDIVQAQGETLDELAMEVVGLGPDIETLFDCHNTVVEDIDLLANGLEDLDERVIYLEEDV